MLAALPFTKGKSGLGTGTLWKEVLSAASMTECVKNARAKVSASVSYIVRSKEKVIILELIRWNRKGLVDLLLAQNPMRSPVAVKQV